MQTIIIGKCLSRFSSSYVKGLMRDRGFAEGDRGRCQVDKVVPFSPERRRMCSFVWVPDDDDAIEDQSGGGGGEGSQGGHYRVYVKGAAKVR